MRQRRIMILGGNIVQAEATLAARRMGYYTISADLHPDNPGHAMADEYCCVDIIDREAVLCEARRLRIDGIVPYSSDTLAPIAAYVAEEMGLPGNPYEAVVTLTRKDRFRRFLRAGGFAVPESEAFGVMAEARRFVEALAAKGHEAIMKPADAAGARGVFRIGDAAGLEAHWDETLAASRCRRVVVERFIERVGCQVDGDVFVHDGRIIFAGFADQYQGLLEAPFVQTAHCCPSSQPMLVQERALQELQRLFSLLGMRTGPFNVEFVTDRDGRIYFLDMGPRNGGCMIPLLEERTIGFRETEYTVRAAVGDTLPEWSAGVIPAPGEARPVMQFSAFAREDGIVRGLWMSDAFRDRVFYTFPFIRPGEQARRPRSAGDTVALVFAEFPDQETMQDTILNMHSHLRVL